MEETVQNHRESMGILQSPHAFAVINPAQRPCTSPAKAWHPNLLVISETDYLGATRIGSICKWAIDASGHSTSVGSASANRRRDRW